MRRRLVTAAALAAALIVPAAAGADSVFGIRGVGILGRPFSARAASSAGAFAILDATSALNPASFAQLGTPTGWATGAGTSRRFTDGTLSAALGSTRFPLFGFAIPVGRRAVVGLTIGDYLDRTWAVTGSDSTSLRDSVVAYDDKAQSTGGVSDVRLAAAYRITDHLSVGLGLHSLVGSTRSSITRTFTSTAFTTFTETAITDFSGVGISFGAVAQLGGRLALGASARFNGRLTAKQNTGASASVALPAEYGAGAVWIPKLGFGLAASAGYQTWSRAAADLAAAGSPGTRSVWNLAVGAEVTALHVGGEILPLRMGYRWRQLPFPVGTAPLSEHAVSAGFGFGMAGGRASVDAAVEVGSRSGGGATERLTTGYVGLTIRP